MADETVLNERRTESEIPSRNRYDMHTNAARPLTTRQVQVLRCVESFLDARGYPPSIRELCELLDVTSTTGMVEHLRALERKGYLARDAGERRGMRVLVASSSARIVEAPGVRKATLCIRCRREVA